jgi:prepilin-type N-terminal cleavage/methylation domain-containing protein
MRATSSNLRSGSPRGGFTILEVLVAMSILLVGMTAILGLLSFGAAMTRTAALKSAAAISVEALVADLEETLFPLVQAPGSNEWLVGPPIAIEDREIPGHPGVSYSARASGDPNDNRPGGPLRYRVDIEVHWMSGGRVRTKNFQTLMLREVPFAERLRRLMVDQMAAQSDGAAPAANGAAAQGGEESR